MEAQFKKLVWQDRAVVIVCAGYLVLWTAFSLAATLTQWGLHSA